MRHLTDGTLRRFLDEPRALPEAARSHLDRCSACSARLAAAASDRALATHLLSPSPTGTDVAATLRHRDAAPTLRSRLPWTPPRLDRLAYALAAAALGALVAFTPVGSYAANLLSIFTPRTVQPISISRGMLKGLQALRNYGTLSRLSPTLPAKTVPDVSAAEALAGAQVRTPSSLPAGVGGAPRFLVTPPTTVTFTFSATKAAAYAARTGQTLPAMPSGIDGTTLYFVAHPAVIELFGGTDLRTMPTLAIAQMRAPRIDAQGGVTAQELENYLLAQPGISPQLRAELKSLGSPGSILPVPIPPRATETTVTVQGVPGIAISDRSGIENVLLWEKDGMLYAVLGTVSTASLETVAGGLH